MFELDDGQEFEESVLDFRETEMLLVQNLSRARQIQFVVRALGPREVDQPIQVGARHGVFGGGKRDLLQTFEFFQRHLFRLLGQPILLHLLAQGIEFPGIGIVLAQLPLNGSNLFPEEKVALTLGHRGRDFLLNFAPEGQDLQFLAEQREQSQQSFLDHSGLQEVLPLLEIEVQVRRDQIGQFSRLLGIEGRDLDLIRKGRRQIDDLLELDLGIAGQSGHLHGVFHDFPEDVDPGAQIRLLRRKFFNLKPSQPLHEHPHGVVGKLQHLQNSSGAPVLPEISGQWFVFLGVMLKHQTEKPISSHHVVDQPDALRRLDQKWCDHSRKHHDVRQSQNRQYVRKGFGPRLGDRDLSGASGGAKDANKFRVWRSHRRAL